MSSSSSSSSISPLVARLTKQIDAISNIIAEYAGGICYNCGIVRDELYPTVVDDSQPEESREMCCSDCIEECDGDCGDINTSCYYLNELLEYKYPDQVFRFCLVCAEAVSYTHLTLPTICSV